MLKVSEAIDEKVRTDNGGTVLVALCLVKQAKLQKVRQSSEQRRNGDESEEELVKKPEKTAPSPFTM